MNSCRPNFEPYGILYGMGNTGQTPRYRSRGTRDNPQQMWQYPATMNNFAPWSYRAGGYATPADRYAGYHAASVPYSAQEIANMRGQLEFGGDNGAFAWRDSMMSRDDWMRELERHQRY